MSEGFTDLGGVVNAVPQTMRELLIALRGKIVVIVFPRCCREQVRILAVRDNMLICRTREGRIKFVEIACICEVITNCEDAFMRFLNE